MQCVSTKVTILMAIICGAMAEDGYSGTWSWNGTEKGFWDSHSVVHATFLGVVSDSHGRAKEDGNGFRLWRFRINSTLTGPYDAMRDATEEVTIRVESTNTCAQVHIGMPSPNDQFILLVTASDKGTIELLCDVIVFFPSICAVEPVKDLNDPSAIKLIANLRRIRGKGVKAATVGKNNPDANN